ncbi:MAG: rhodanese-like domain-containing protein [Sporolactobacillus sp.]
MDAEISPKAVAQLLASGVQLNLIDVREVDEFTGGHIPGAVNIPLNVLQIRAGEIDRTAEHIVVCLSGSRSAMATGLLASAGYRVRNMRGGMMNWRGPVAY